MGRFRCVEGWVKTRSVGRSALAWTRAVVLAQVCFNPARNGKVPAAVRLTALAVAFTLFELGCMASLEVLRLSPICLPCPAWHAVWQVPPASSLDSDGGGSASC